MDEESRAGAVAWVAALEQLPADSRGFRRTLRLHAVALHGTHPAPRAACGYEHRAEELRTDRGWETVTSSGRCALCELRLRRATDVGVDLVESVDLVDRTSAASRRLSVVPDEVGRAVELDQDDRRSPGRP